MKKYVWVILFNLFVTNVQLYAQAVSPFGCTGNYYVTYGNAADPSASTSIDKVSYNGTSVTATFYGTATNYGFNGADINPIDGFMYGTRYSNSVNIELLKIDSNANVTVVGTLPPTVSSAQNVFSGCFDYNGDFYIGNTAPAGMASSIYKVNTTTADAVLVGSTGVLPDDPNAQLFFVDIAIDPTTGIMYGASNYCCAETGANSKALYTIDKTTGAATKIGQFTTASGYQTTGYGLFFTGKGDLFLYGTDANFYLVNKATAQITSLGTGSTYSFADGCGCSYRIDHTLATSTPSICLPVSQLTSPVTFTETFINNRGSEVDGAAYHLDLDNRFQFTQSADDIKNILIGLGIATASTTVSFSSVNGGTNNAIDISPINIPYTGQGTKVSFTLNTSFSNTTGPASILIASRIYNLPAIIGGVAISDNPLTIIPGDSTRIVICDHGPLPVTFISLNAFLDGSSKAVIQWKTAEELNTLNYVIECSTDGKNFTTAGIVSATNAGDYSFIDNTTPLNDKLYYRVKSVDASGNTTYTPIIVITRSKQQLSITVTPNPFKDKIQLQLLSSREQQAIVHIFGADGKMYQNYQFNVQKGTSVTTLTNTSDLPAGLYAVFVNLTGTGEVYSTKVLKQ